MKKLNTILFILILYSHIFAGQVPSKITLSKAQNSGHLFDTMVLSGIHVIKIEINYDKGKFAYYAADKNNPGTYNYIGPTKKCAMLVCQNLK